MSAGELSQPQPDPGYIRGPMGLLEDFRLRTPPRWAVYIAIVAVVASWVPLGLILRARFSTNSQPRIHFFQDMDNQPKFRPQASNAMFADGRAMRPAIPGAVARGKLNEDPHLNQGFRVTGTGAEGQPAVEFFDGYPGAIQAVLDDPGSAEAFLRRGQNRFDIYCATCHGQDGQGNGPIHVRAAQLQANGVEGVTWNQPNNLTDAARRERSNGHMYNSITNGIRTMGGYGGQINVQDRWAIVAYVRALQFAQSAKGDEPGVIPADKAGTLK